MFVKLGERFARFGLTLHPDTTRLITAREHARRAPCAHDVAATVLSTAPAVSSRMSRTWYAFGTERGQPPLSSRPPAPKPSPELPRDANSKGTVLQEDNFQPCPGWMYVAARLECGLTSSPTSEILHAGSGAVNEKRSAISPLLVCLLGVEAGCSDREDKSLPPPYIEHLLLRIERRTQLI